MTGAMKKHISGYGIIVLCAAAMTFLPRPASAGQILGFRADTTLLTPRTITAADSLISGKAPSTDSLLKADSLSLDTKQAVPSDTVRKDSLQEVQHALRIGFDIAAPLIPVISGKDYDKGWMIQADFRLTPKLYVAADFGYSKRRFDFSAQKMDIDGWFARAGINYSLMRGIFSYDDMMFVGLKAGYSQYDRRLYGASINDDYWGGTENIDINDRPSAIWGDLSLGVMVRVVKNVYLSMQGGYDLILSSTKPNGIGPLAVPGMGQVYNSSAGFSFSYTISYRIPLYKKMHRVKIRQKPETEEDRQKAQQEREKEKPLEPAYNPVEILEE